MRLFDRAGGATRTGITPRWFGWTVGVISCAFGWNATALAQRTDELTAEAQAAEQRLRQSLPADSEAMAMLEAIVAGRSMTRNDGWFNLAKPQTAYGWEQMLASYDTDGDGQISKTEFPGREQWFAALDRNRDGALNDADHGWNIDSGSSNFQQLARRVDADDDGRITESELQAMTSKLLANQEFLSIDELRLAWEPPPRSGASFERPTASQLIIGLEKQEIGSHMPGPNVGEQGGDFTLKTLKGEEVNLAKWCSEKPVVLIFGNFTCGPFRAQAGNLERLFDRYREQFHFLVVYVREAHPSDGWAMRRNESADIKLPQPTKYPERVAVAQQCQNLMGSKIPLVVDEMDDPVGRQYSGMPSRLYLLDAERQVLFKSGRGPHYFSPSELEEALLWHLTETEPSKVEGSVQEPGPSAQSNAPSSRDPKAAWSQLGIEFPALPTWAERLSDSLPESTLALLKLDHLHRQANPLGREIAAKIRWIVADALHSPYGKATAEFDLLRAGKSSTDILEWQQQIASPSEPNAKLWAFAKQLTQAGHSISDESFAEIHEQWQTESTVAIVHTIAFANFENRLWLALGLTEEDKLNLAAVLPPDGWRGEDARTAPSRPDLAETLLAAPTDPSESKKRQAGWNPVNFDLLQAKLKSQQQRSSRVPLPHPDRLGILPEEERKRSEKVVWSNISLGYQPELTQGWFNLMRTFRREANLDRVFSNSLFWVVTRSNECFY
ncbi:MAG: deiodinase family protein [Planctomycetaceae bacterium]|nr:deiodinase family protein [Planctomycetaceae bacterium]